jgi:DNA-binding NarL/FixJ family response regulator
MSGMEVLQKLKKDYPLTKVMMITVVDREKVIHKTTSLNVDGYLVKPIGKSDLLQAVNTILSEV